MMLAPVCVKERYEKMSYEELLEERDELLEFIKDFEEEKLDREEFMMCPSPAVRYQMDLEYLGQLAPIIAKKYNEKIMD